MAIGLRSGIFACGSHALHPGGRIREHRAHEGRLGRLEHSGIEVISRGVDGRRRTGWRPGSIGGGSFGHLWVLSRSAIYKRRIGIGQRRRTVFTDGGGHTRKHLHVHARRQASDGFRAASSAISRSPMGHAGYSLGIFVSNRRRNLPDLAFLNYNDTEHVRRKKLSSPSFLDR